MSAIGWGAVDASRYIHICHLQDPFRSLSNSLSAGKKRRSSLKAR